MADLPNIGQSVELVDQDGNLIGNTLATAIKVTSQITDSAGNIVTVTGNKLDVNATLSTAVDKVKIWDGTDEALVTSNKDLQTADTFVASLSCGAISVGLTAVEAKVGASTMVNRKGISIFHNGNGKLYYGCSAVTTATGTQVFKNTSIYIPANTTAKVYLISDTAAQDIRIVEFA